MNNSEQHNQSQAISTTMSTKTLTNLVSVPPFDVDSDVESQGQRWTKWLARFENYVLAIGVDNDGQKRALLLHSVGERVYDIFLTLAETGQDYATAKQKLNSRFAPKQNTEFAKFRLRETKQDLGESLDAFHSRLQQLASRCEFPNPDAEVKSQLIYGCSSSRLRKKGLSDGQMTLEKLLEDGRMAELSSTQASGIEKTLKTVSLSSDVNAVDSQRSHRFTKPPQSYRGPQNKQYQSSNRNNNKCNNCGRDYPHKGGMQDCPARGVECYKCHKSNHFAKYCHGMSVKQPSCQTQESIPRSQKPNVNQVVESESEDEYIFNVTSVNNVAQQPQFYLNVNNSPVIMTADSGASCNILDIATYQSMSPRPKLVPTKTKIRPYGGKPLNVLGKFDARIVSRNKKVKDTFYVVPSGKSSLLSFENSQKLGLLTVADHVITDYIINTVSDHNNVATEYMQKHPELVQGVGKLKGFQVKLHVDKSVQPIAQPHRRIPFHSRKKLENELERLESNDIIEKVDGPTSWVSPVVIVPKPKAPDEIRMCVDMRQPNVAIIRERHITPTVQDVQNRLNGASIFSKLDLRNAYHQLELEPESRDITTFSTHAGLRRYKRLSYGVNSASEVFQNVISQVIEGIPGCTNISDDILIFGADKASHDKALIAVFDRLLDRGLTLNQAKCEFNKSSLEFFGFVFSKNGMSPDPRKVTALAEMSVPKSKQEVQSMLGMANYSARFIPDFSTITAPLRNLTHKDVQFEWGHEQQAAVEKIKSALTQDPVLAYFDVHKQTEVIVDASPVGLGAVLVQYDNDTTNPVVVAYGSRSLTPVEQKYCQLEREALAVVWACEHFHLYTYGQHVTIVTDHKPLLGIYGNPKAKLQARLERWSLRLQPYDFKLVYRSGKSNPADYLSRHPLSTDKTPREQKIAEEYINFICSESIPKAMTLEQVKAETQQDLTLQMVIQLIKDDKWHDIDKTRPDCFTLLSFSKLRHELSVNSDGDLILKSNKVVLPANLHEQAVDLAHEGHQGINKTKALLREKIWFSGIDKMVKNKVQQCIACQATVSTKQREPLQMTKLPEGPWQEVSVDFCGPYPHGNYLIVVIDDYSRYPEVESVKSTSARSVIPKLDRIFSTHGIPKIVKSDNGPPFQSKEFSDFARNYGFNHRRVTPYWPEANGEVENFMKPLGKVCKAAQLEGKPWKQEMFSFLRNYRATPHSTTGQTPATVLFGRSIKTKLPQTEKTSQDVEIRHTDQQAKQKIKMYAENRRNVKKSTIAVGDKVLLKNQIKGKLQPHFEKVPFQVIEKKGSMVICQRGKEVKARNSSHVKLVQSPEEPILVEDDVEDELDDDNGSAIAPLLDASCPPSEFDRFPDIVFPPDRALPSRSSLRRNRKIPDRFKEYILT